MVAPPNGLSKTNKLFAFSNKFGVFGWVINRSPGFSDAKCFLCWVALLHCVSATIRFETINRVFV